MKNLFILLTIFFGFGLTNAQEKFNTFYIYNFLNTSKAKIAVFRPIVAIKIENADKWEIQQAIRYQFETYLTNYVQNKMKIDVKGIGIFGRSDVWQRSVELEREEALEYAAKCQKEKKILFTGTDFNFQFTKPKN